MSCPRSERAVSSWSAGAALLLLGCPLLGLAHAQGITMEGRATIASQLYGYVDDVTFVDIDGDGRRDALRCGEDGTDSYLYASILDGDAAFRSVFVYQDYFQSMIPTGLIAADLDNDGDLEFLHASAFHGMRVLAANGAGEYGPVATMAGPARGKLAAMDIDGDGDVDVLAVGQGTLLYVYENVGGTLAPGTTQALGAESHDLAVGDFDGDGDPDVVVSHPALNLVSILTNPGNGVFSLAQVSVTGGPWDIALADLDADGDLDAMVSRYLAGNLAVLVNQGSGAFAAPVLHATGPGCLRLDVGDVDGDGDQDIAVTNGASTQAISLLRNHGGGTFAPFERHGEGPYQQVGLVDLDQDGDLDLAVAGGPALRNRGDGTFPTPSLTPFAGGQYQVVRAADLDGDGDEDLAIVGAGLNVQTLRNDGGGQFVPASVIDAPMHTAVDIALADFDGDGDLDTMATSTGSSRVFLCRSPGNATLGPAETLSNTQGFVRLHAIDFDGDGPIDVVARTYNGHFFARNQGSGTFDPFVPLTGVAQPSTVADDVADLDGDGDFDFAFLTQSGVRVLENLGGGTFGSPITLGPGAPASGASPFAISAVDLDGDLDRDLVAMLQAGPVVHWNQGGFAFSGPSSLNGRYGRLLLEDLDSDGDLDVTTLTSDWTACAFVHENLGGGAFAPASISGAGEAFGGLGLAAVDTDLDGDRDFVGFGLTSRFVLENRARSGTSFCLGDGSATACPCGNASAPNLRAGCVNSNGRAGALVATGSTKLSSDGLVLRGSGMSNSFALYFQGTSASNGGLGAVFGDGLRCAGGSVVRLDIVQNVAGASTCPAIGDPPLRALGFVTTPGERVYQVWYRDAASFCTPSTFNLTNGLRIAWQL